MPLAHASALSTRHRALSGKTQVGAKWKNKGEPNGKKWSKINFFEASTNSAKIAHFKVYRLYEILAIYAVVEPHKSSGNILEPPNNLGVGQTHWQHRGVNSRPLAYEPSALTIRLKVRTPSPKARSTI